MVQYSVSLDSVAGIPSWLTLLQSDSQDAASQAFLYGTPEEDNIGQITLNVSTKFKLYRSLLESNFTSDFIMLKMRT